MSGLLNSINTWRTKSPAPKPVNGDKEPRGTKRKAKGDPYDDIDDGKFSPRMYATDCLSFLFLSFHQLH